MDVKKWMPTNGCHQMDANKWMPTNGRPTDAYQQIDAQSIDGNTIDANKVDANEWMSTNSMPTDGCQTNGRPNGLDASKWMPRTNGCQHKWMPTK